MKLYTLVLSSLLSLSLLAQNEQDTVKTFKPAKLPQGYTQQLDVVYTGGENWQKKMDIYLPPANGKPTPLVINIHGGGWSKGNKESQSNGFGSFFKIGYAVANISYRLTGEATAPAAVEDARCALAYIKKNAKALNVDPKKIVIMGGSAGGHLALLAGMLGNNDLFDSACKKVEDMQVAAIIDKYGITDVQGWADYGKSKSPQRWLGDKKDDYKFVQSVSPIHWVSQQNPPILIIHGDADSTVPYYQSVKLYNKLKEYGVKTNLITIKNGGHGKFDDEGKKLMMEAILQFLQEVIGK